MVEFGSFELESRSLNGRGDVARQGRLAAPLPASSILPPPSAERVPTTVASPASRSLARTQLRTKMARSSFGIVWVIFLVNFVWEFFVMQTLDPTIAPMLPGKPASQ